MKKLKKEAPYLVFALPAFIIYTVFCVYPLLQTIGLSFTDWNGISMEGLHWKGFQNYAAAIRNPDITSALLKTLIYTFSMTTVTTILAILLSVALNGKMKTRNFQRALFFFPSVVSTIVIGFLWSYVLSPTSQGIITLMLKKFGLRPILWLGKYDLAMLSVIVVGVWAAVGWHTCIYIARLQSIPAEYYEAAAIDGANRFQIFWKITLPMLAPAMTVSVLLLMMNGMKVFDLPFALTNGGPGNATTMMSQIIIKKSLTEKCYGQACAMSAMFFILISIVGVLQLLSMKKREEM